MAITIGNTDVSDRNLVVDTTAPHSFVLTKPTNAIEGTYAIVFIGIEGDTGSSVTFTPEAGWTTIVEQTTANGTSATAAIYYKKMTGSEPSTYTFASALSSGATRHGQAMIFVVSGADATTFQDATVTVDDNSTTTAPPCPSITTVTDNAVVIGFYASVDGRHLVAQDSNGPTGMTVVYNRVSAVSSSGTTMGIAYKTVTPAGATGIMPWTGTLSTSNGIWAATVAIRPEAAGGGTISVTPGQVVFTGSDLALNLGAENYSLAVDASQMVFTGQEIPFQITQPGNIGQLVFTGQNVALVHDEQASYVMDVIAGELIFDPSSVITLAATFNGTGTVEHGTLTFTGGNVLLLLPTSVSDARGGGPFKVPYGYIVSATGRARWRSYVPVQQVVPTVHEINTYAAEGAITVDLLDDVTGLTEWIDYIPIVEVSDGESGKWRFDNDGWIPVIFTQ
jgi:hypothetical protein